MRNPLILLSAGLLLALVVAELLLRGLPVSTGYDFGPVDARDPILRGSPRFEYTYSHGWNFRLSNSGVLNNYGFRSSYDYVLDPRALVVVGNSFVQADALDPRDTLAERLGGLLHLPAYGVGVDGFSLADYLAAARWSRVVFAPRTLLILLTTNDLDHSCAPRLGQHYLKFSQGAVSLELVERTLPSRSKHLLNESHLFRYVFDNLRATANWTKGWRRSIDSGASAESNPQGASGCAGAGFRRAAAQFLLDSFDQLRDGGAVRVVFMLAPNYRREEGALPGSFRDVHWFAEQAAAAGYPVLRLDSAFSAALHAGIRLDFLPIDGHWTAAANLLAAQLAAGALSSEGR